MTRADVVRNCLHTVLDMSTDEQIADFLLHFARSSANEDGSIYALWCDDQGACKDKPWEGECPCTDEDQLGCILRFLRQEYEPSNVSEPRGI